MICKSYPIALSALFTVSGCAVETAGSSGSESESSLSTDGVPGSTDGSPEGQLSSEGPFSIDELDSTEQALANCVYIQYCHDPAWGPRSKMVICRLRSSCRNKCGGSNSALWDECERDANAVCGGFRGLSFRGCP
jgi:hypothetical protein